MALSCVGEGCHKQMEAVLPEIMDGVLSFLQDSVSTLIDCVVGTLSPTKIHRLDISYAPHRQ